MELRSSATSARKFEILLLLLAFLCMVGLGSTFTHAEEFAHSHIDRTTVEGVAKRGSHSHLLSSDFKEVGKYLLHCGGDIFQNFAEASSLTGINSAHEPDSGNSFFSDILRWPDSPPPRHFSI